MTPMASEVYWRDLSSGDWVATGPFRVNGDHMTAEQLDRSDFLHDARQILLTLRDHGPLKANRSYNLAREAVALLQPQLRLSDPALKEGVFKVIDDGVDHWLLIQRNVLQLTKLMVYRTQFHIGTRGRALLADDRRGELLALLFVGLFRDADLRNLDRSDREYPGLDAGLPACFYLIGQTATDWISAKEITEATWLPAMRSEPERPASSTVTAMQHLTYAYTARVIRPLVAFGLMERSGQEAERDAEVRYRTTPLFSALLHFRS